MHHRGQECIALIFNYQKEIQDIVKRLAGMRWSQTHRCWYVAFGKESFEYLYSRLKGKAILEMALLKKYLERRKTIEAVIPASPGQNSSKTIVHSATWQISKENLASLDRFMQQLKLKAYSNSTIRTYKNELMRLLQVLKKNM